MKRYDTDVMAGLVIPAKPAWTACDTPYRDCAQTADAGAIHLFDAARLLRGDAGTVRA
jgi:hypothetical protein